MASANPPQDSAQQTPQSLLPALKHNSEKLEREHYENLRSHADQSIATMEAVIEKALNTIAPIEKNLEQVESTLLGLVEKAEKNIEQHVGAAMKKVQGLTLEQLAAAAAAAGAPNIDGPCVPKGTTSSAGGKSADDDVVNSNQEGSEGSK